MRALGGNPPASSGSMMQPGLLVRQVSVVDPERGRRTCGWGDAAAGERFGFCGAILLMQRPNNRFDPSLRSGLDHTQDTGAPPLFVGQVEDTSG